MKTSPITEPHSATLQRLTDLLFEEQASCVVRSGDVIHILRRRGVRDLYELLTQSPELLQGALIADKVVGKGAAALMVLGGVKELFADVVSYPALELLVRYRIPVSYTVAVEHIVNRTQSGRCPIEERCLGVESPEECLVQIEEFLSAQA